MASQSVIDIAADGDVVLVCGADPDNVQRLRVSSAILNTGSKVFKAMFSSQRFREGHALATASSAEVALPDDDAPSVGILCGIMHMRYDLVPQTLSTIDILNLALVCDKYACAMVVKPSVEVWVERELKTAGDQVRAQLMKAACLLRNTASIHRVGVQMVMRSTGPVNHKGETLHGIPRGLLASLEQQRLAAKIEAYAAIENVIDSQVTSFDGISSCMHGHMGYAYALTSLVRQLENSGLWPIRSLNSVPLLQLLERMETINIQNPQMCATCRAQAPYRPTHTLEQLRPTLALEAKQVRQAVEGLDLSDVLRESNILC